jgi:hypothetical protein
MKMPTALIHEALEQVERAPPSDRVCRLVVESELNMNAGSWLLEVNQLGADGASFALGLGDRIWVALLFVLLPCVVD